MNRCESAEIFRGQPRDSFNLSTIADFLIESQDKTQAARSHDYYNEIAIQYVNLDSANCCPNLEIRYCSKQHVFRLGWHVQL